MKKIIKVALCYVMVLILTVLTFGNENTVYAASQKSLEKKATKYLNTSSKNCKNIMNTIYNSWYFQVYEADDYYDESILSAYSEETGIPQSKVKSIIKKISGETDGVGIAATIQVLDYNLSIVDTYYRQKGTFKKIKKNLAQAKKTIKKLKKKSRKKKKLQKYYNAVNKYYKYVSDPSGSFAQLGNKKSSLDEKVDDCKEALSW